MIHGPLFFFCFVFSCFLDFLSAFLLPVSVHTKAFDMRIIREKLLSLELSINVKGVLSIETSSLKVLEAFRLAE
jgi:hypothetical protein